MTTGANAATIRPGISAIREGVRILPRWRISLSYRYSCNTLTCHTREKRVSKYAAASRSTTGARAVYGLIAVVLMLLIRIKGFVKLVAPAACRI
jgi:hypothetical protein